MKKVTTILTAIILLLSITAFASEGETVTAKVKLAFEKDFVKAKDVNWKKTGEFYFASFSMNDALVDAAYNEDGELVGTSRKISTTHSCKFRQARRDKKDFSKLKILATTTASPIQSR